MKILYLTGGAGQMYCGSCLRDNALASELISRGTMWCCYRSTRRPSPTNKCQSDKVFFGGISVYLRTVRAAVSQIPRWLDRLWDSKLMLQLATDAQFPPVRKCSAR